jgi:hypothetical protein
MKINLEEILYYIDAVITLNWCNSPEDVCNKQISS